MTDADLAAIHADAMNTPEPWSARTIRSFAEAPGGILITTSDGFALGRVNADEAELLTIAVRPEAQRQGTGRACLAEFESVASERGAVRAFLEVAETNVAARALYQSAGYAEDGRRKDYYRVSATKRVDAILMSKNLRKCEQTGQCKPSS